MESILREIELGTPRKTGSISVGNVQKKMMLSGRSMEPDDERPLYSECQGW